MTDTTVKIESGSDVATIELRGVTIVEPRFRLRDTATEKFLTRRGWSKTPSYLPGEAVVEDDVVRLTLDGNLVRRIPAGASLSLEQPASNVFATISWPSVTTATDTDPEEGTGDEPEAADEAPVSLEPSIREEAILPFHAPEIVADTNDNGREETDDDEVPARSWGLVAATAVLFLLLGSLLTYFWQSSAYESDLRTAMRALEVQRDEDRAAFEKRLAEAQASSSVPSSDGGDASDAAGFEIAGLKEQSAQLARDRDAAREALAQQQAAVAELEQRLATANGEIETLKASQEADATEQTAVFNQRITDLTAELDQARKELTQSKSELASKDQSLAKATNDIKAANVEIAALKKSAGEQQNARNEALEGKIATLSAELDKTTQSLADRDQALRDVRAKLSVANVQIEALKKVAGRATETDLERSSLADRITQLTTELDKTDKELEDKEQELAKARTSLDAANALLASNAEEMKRIAADAVPTSPAQDAASSERLARLQQERDLYADELRSMTESFSALKAEKDKLAESVKELEARLSDAGAGTTLGGSRAIWGATAIDRTGAIYSLQNQTAEKAAADNVLALCRGKSQADCEPLRTYSNSCFSLARIEGEPPGNDNFGFAVNRDRQAAESGALRQCEELGSACTTRFTACSPDTLSRASVDQ